MSTDFASLIEPVARALLGEPNRAQSSKTELRFGTNGSMAVDLEKGTYYDFETEKGGGTLDLVMRHSGDPVFNHAEAVTWLQERGFVEEERPPVANGHAAPKIVASYDYQDEAEHLVFQVVRLEPKTFRQRRPDGQGGWIWSVKGIPLVPYRLPELRQAIADEEVVFIVEGEKDVDRLLALGLNATCNPMGAGKWRKELSAHFQGARVVIIPDNDEAGRKHADQIGASLSDVAGYVLVLNLPGLPPKGDVTDWRDAGGTIDELLRLAAEAPPWSPAVAPLPFGATWFGDQHALPVDEWLIDGLLPREGLCMMFGAPKSGKSFLAQHLSLAIARNIEVFGRRTWRCGVIYIAAEGRLGFVRKRLRAYRQELVKTGEQIPFLTLTSTVNLHAEPGDTAALLAMLPAVNERMRAMGAPLGLVVVDTHAAVSPGAEENASGDMTKIIRHYQQIQKASHAAVLIVHHKNAAGDKSRGHTSLYGAMDSAIEVNCDEAKVRTAKLDKLKDGEDGARIAFELQSVTIGTRDDGKPITSCVVVPAQVGVERTGKGPKLPDREKVALQALRFAIEEHGEPTPTMLNLAASVTRVVRAGKFKEEFLKRAFVDEPNESTFRGAVKRVIDGLMSKKVIGHESPYLWIVRDATR
jgi:KaiC/GvpD/RAD55 family RecA-like ATPase